MGHTVAYTQKCLDVLSLLQGVRVSDVSKTFNVLTHVRINVKYIKAGQRVAVVM